MTVIPTSSTSTPPVVSFGLESGLNTQQIIQAELQPYQQPETNLKTEQTTLNTHVTEYQTINSDLVALQTDASSLAVNSGWNARQATSTDNSILTASAAPGTPSGSLQLVVKQLATASSLVSTGTVTSTSQIVDTQPSLLVSQAGVLGFTALASGTGLTLGSHTIEVTQSSQAASTTGTLALGSQTSGIGITAGSNDTLSVTVNGTSYNLTISPSAPGGDSGTALLTALQSAISTAGASGVLQAGYDANGNLILSTVNQGSTQSLQVTGGDALATLGLSIMSGAATGADGVVTVDGTSNTLTTVTAGGPVTLNGAGGEQVTGTIESTSAQSQANSSLLSTGSVTATNISTGNGSLSDIVANINSADLGITASAVQTGSNQFLFQLSSSTTGTDSALSVDPSAFAGSSLGTMNVASVGKNAIVLVGGTGGFAFQSQTDTVSGLLPGLTINLVAASANPVTVNVAPDAGAMTSAVKNLVADANAVLNDIQTNAGYNAQTKTAGPLMGSAVLQTITNEVQAIIASVSGSSTLGNALNIGISLASGQVQFNQSTFAAAFAKNPSQVAAMFTQDGTFSPSAPSYTGEVSLSFAGNSTKAGSYDVQISQSAAQATDTGAVLAGGTVSAAEQLTVSMGSNSAQYSTTAGESLTSVAAGLNAAFAAAGMSVSAQLVNGGQQLVLTSDDYGSKSSFTVTSTNSGAGTTGLTGTFAGLDVAGTINGVAATGVGQFLSAPLSDPTLAGISVQVTTPNISSLTDLGSLHYLPGIAQSLTSLAGAMSDPTQGEITRTIKNLQDQSTGLNSQIAFYANIVAQEQQMLLGQFAKLEQTLGTLKNQSSALAGELAQIAANHP
ncbi:MAG TPA: flagellar filament capping protein FliD [Acidimicrobiales bacterium]|nr:flagellar filament capping protein FliD [Acidimicrobiales bacterium]